MVAGETLTIARINVKNNFTHSQSQDWTQYCYALSGGDYSISAYSYFLFGTASTNLYKYVSGAWVFVALIDSVGFEATKTKTGTLPQTGYYRITCATSNTASQSGSCTIEQNNAPRIAGNELRLINATFSGYLAAGTEITAALANNGQVCTY